MVRKYMYSYLILIFTLLTLASCSSRNTCDICGYQAIKGNECQLCGNPVWEDSNQMSQEEYIKTKQLDWFSTPGMDIYGPKKVEDYIDEGTFYMKDSIWEPIIRPEDLQ